MTAGDRFPSCSSWIMPAPLLSPKTHVSSLAKESSRIPPTTPSSGLLTPLEEWVPAGHRPSVSHCNLKENEFWQPDSCQEILIWNCEFGVDFQSLVLEYDRASLLHGYLILSFFWLEDIEKWKPKAVIFGFEWAENRRKFYLYRAPRDIITHKAATFSLTL